MTKTQRPSFVVAFIRHGAYMQPQGVPSAHLPYALSAEGREQARAAAAPLWAYARERELHVDDVIDCSRMRRSWETALILAESLGALRGSPLRVEEHDDLAERSLGAAANLTEEAIERLVLDDPRYATPPPGWKRDPSYRVPLQGAESLLDAGLRVARHVRDCAGERPDGADGGSSRLKLLVGHGGAFRHAAFHLGVLTQDQLGSLSMHHVRPVFLERDGTGNHTTFRHVGGEWKRRSTDATVD